MLKKLDYILKDGLKNDNFQCKKNTIRLSLERQN